MIVGATVVPIAIMLPTCHYSPMAGRHPFARQEEVGTHRKFEVRQTGFEKIDRAAGIDSPEGTLFLQLSDPFHAIWVEHGMADVRHQSAVEIGADEPDLRKHEGGNLGIHFGNAIRLRSSVEAAVPGGQDCERRWGQRPLQLRFGGQARWTAPRAVPTLGQK